MVQKTVSHDDAIENEKLLELLLSMLYFTHLYKVFIKFYIGFAKKG